jgi:hypothetical protein
MTTLTAPAPKSKAGRTARPFACSMTVEINGQSYGVEPIDPGECGTKAFRLAKRWADGAVYDVIRDNDGHVACDCPDYECRHRGNGFGLCKHGKALVALGLIDAPKAPESPAKAIEPDARPFAAGVPSDAPSDRDRAAAKAFGVRLPAKAEPRPLEDQLLAVLACPDCEGEGCAACVDQAPADAPSEAAGEPAEADESFADELAEATASEPASEPRGDEDGPTDPERLTLAEWLDHEAARYTAMDHAAGDMLAATIAELARRVRFVEARSVADYESRWELIEAPAA